MKFRLELDVKPFEKQLDIADTVMLTGSCFTEHIGHKLALSKFNVLENPNGILFNPVSILQSIETWVANRQYADSDLFFHNELWTSWDFHGKFSGPDAELCLQEMNTATHAAHHFLKHAKWIIITLGSAFVYELNSHEFGGRMNRVVANCHKVPANHFKHRLLSYDETCDALNSMVQLLRSFNENIGIIFTISPVRHYREGLVENNRSKGLLHNAVAHVLQAHPNVFYFPAYELIIDDLRDYRFYAEDLVHPNYAATTYVWEKFAQACINQRSLAIIERLEPIRLAFQHRAHHSASLQHQKFLRQAMEKTQSLQQEFPFLNLSAELCFFSGTTQA